MSFAASRSTQNLSVPATQNTAPIIEFRCLYTHDLRQKKKRWQDGMLRFHTFNKRIMVYDVPRNFIGDTHWREDETVQDGDELRLDKGVLIQVGEVTGSTEQDLTELLEKRRPMQEKSRNEFSPRSSHPASARSTAIPLNQLRPKSLNALLGTPRGTYGRAILPNKSPFESRNAGNVRHVEQELSAKRQKVDHGLAAKGGALRPVIQQPDQSSTSRPLNASHSANFSRALMLPRQEIQDVISIDSDDDAVMSSSPAKAATPSTSRPLKVTPRPAIAPAKANKPAPKHSKVQPPTLPTVTQCPESSNTGNRKPVRKNASSGTEDSRPFNPLRLSSTKARRKLMYREVLPQRTSSGSAERSSRKAAPDESAPPTSETTDEILRLRRKRREQRRSTEEFDRVEDLNPMISHQSPPGRGRVKVPGIFPSLASVDPKEDGAIQPDESPHQNKHPPQFQEDEPEESLFLTQETPGEIEAAAELARMDEILLVRRKSDTTSANQPAPPAPPAPPKTGRKPISAQQIPATNDPLPPLPPHPLPKQTSKPPSLPPHHSTTTTTTIGLPRGPTLQPIPLPPNPRRSPLRKSLSESGKGPKMIEAPRSKVSLQRAVSDTTEARISALGTSITGAKGVVKGAVKEVAEVQAAEKDSDTGPWSREAFDLFGWREGDVKGKGGGVAAAGRGAS